MPAKQHWEIMTDPARKDWPGVLIVGPNRALIAVDAGSPQPNFHASYDLAARIRLALETSTPAEK